MIFRRSKPKYDFEHSLEAAELRMALSGHRRNTAPPTEHPVRCPATQPPLLGDGHTHECGHPAKLPEGVIGIAEHWCRECGCTWTEATKDKP